MKDQEWPKVTGRTFVLSVGKAATQMAASIYDRLPHDAEGLIVTRQGYAQARFAPDKLSIIEASHPVPDGLGAKAAQLALSAANALVEDDLLLVLMSGGASALLPAPADGISLAEKQTITKALLRCGAPIEHINIVRKHLSAIKGGRLAERAFPAATHMIAISDIPGDDVSMIGSGPTIADASTCADALSVIDRYSISIPHSVRSDLNSGKLETPKSDNLKMQRISTNLCARPADMCAAAQKAVEANGYKAVMLGDALEGDAITLGQEHAKLALKLKSEGGKAALISGGEATVTVSNPNGRGGRCSAYLLACIIALDGASDICGFAADSDGIDGSEDNAGAFFWPQIQTVMGGPEKAGHYLKTDNSYLAFKRSDALLMTGPSGTNVNDLRVIFVG